MITDNKTLLSLSSFRKCDEENTIEYGVYPQKEADLAPEMIEQLKPIEGTPYLTNGEQFFYYLKEKDKWFEVEPIRWKAVKYEGEYLLFTTERCVDTLTYEKGDEYQLSRGEHRIKTYLNKEFLPMAFLDGGELLIESPDYNAKVCILTTTQMYAREDLLLFHTTDDFACGLTDFVRVKGGKDVGSERAYYIVNSNDYLVHIVIGIWVTYYEKDPYNPYSGYSGNYALRPTILLKMK